MAPPLLILAVLTALSMFSVWLAVNNILPGFIVTTGGGLISLWVTFRVWRGGYRDIDLDSVKGWRLVLAAFLAVELTLLMFNVPAIRKTSAGEAVFMLLWFTAFTGIFEEFWWRGIWFAVWRNRPFICIVAGSVLFGSVHLVQNSLSSVLVKIGIGLILGAVRYRGASIGALALVHGICFNWLNSTLLTWDDRMLPGQFGAAVPVLRFVISAAIAWYIYRYGDEKRS